MQITKKRHILYKNFEMSAIHFNSGNSVMIFLNIWISYSISTGGFCVHLKCTFALMQLVNPKCFLIPTNLINLWTRRWQIVYSSFIGSVSHLALLKKILLNVTWIIFRHFLHLYRVFFVVVVFFIIVVCCFLFYFRPYLFEQLAELCMYTDKNSGVWDVKALKLIKMMMKIWSST